MKQILTVVAYVLLWAMPAMGEPMAFLFFQGDAQATKRYLADDDAPAASNTTWGLTSAGKLCDLAVMCDAAPGAGTSWDFVLEVNGSAVTDVSCTISDTATACLDTSGAVCSGSLAAEDAVTVYAQPTGSPTTRRCRASLHYTDTDGSEHAGVVNMGNALVITPVDGRFCGLYSPATFCNRASASDTEWPMPNAGAFTSMTIRLNSASTADQYTVRNESLACDYNFQATFSGQSALRVTCASGSGAQCATCDFANQDRVVIRYNNATPESHARRVMLEWGGAGGLYGGQDTSQSAATDYFSPLGNLTGTTAPYRVGVATQLQRLTVHRAVADTGASTHGVCHDATHAIPPTCSGANHPTQVILSGQTTAQNMSDVATLAAGDYLQMSIGPRVTVDTAIQVYAEFVTLPGATATPTQTPMATSTATPSPTATHTPIPPHPGCCDCPAPTPGGPPEAWGCHTPLPTTIPTMCATACTYSASTVCLPNP